MSADEHMLSGAYALDAIDDEIERRRFERHLRDCEACQEEVRTFRAATVALGEAVAVSPPPGLRERVLAEISATRQVDDGGPSGAETTGPDAPPEAWAAGSPGQPGTRAGRRSARPRPARRGTAVAAAVALLVGGGAAVGGYGVVRARQAQEQAQDEAARVLAIAADPRARRLSGPVTGGGSLTVVVAGSRAALVTDGVPALASERVYQLWVVRPGGISSAGLGPEGEAAAGRWSRIIDGVRGGDKVAVSVEPAGGSAQPTTTPVTLVQL